MSTRTADRGLALYGAARAELLKRCERAIRRARRSGRGTVATLTVRVDPEVDPSAVVFASRRPGDAWACMEQPDRHGAALGALGSVVRLEGRGPQRFATAASAWRRLAADAIGDAPDGPPGAGLVALGGFSFAPDGAQAPHWSGFGAADLIVPELSLARRGRDVRLTMSALAEPDDVPDELVARIERRLAELRERPLPYLDPAPAGRFRIASTAPPEHYEAAVARAVEQIRAGAFEKIVLAREVAVHAPAPHDAAAVFGVLRAGFDSCYVYCVGRGESAFVGASPELLVRREGLRASTVALAGSTRRSADPAVDAHLGEQLLSSRKDREEQAIVTRRIARALRRHSVWVAAPDEPAIIRVANIQHLATPIRAQLTQPVSAIELAGLLHPTPAVGGEPHAVAAPQIPAFEGLDRGWYAGPVGWTDANEDGEFCVALRCALLRGAEARLYAGVGVVRESDPAAELAETEVKLGALLPVLAG
ncbi:MAG TPA: isochorismate synthase [Solirubrobacteraceae bacterium]|nr:isochorismate synthase [Solirubrobacteraceae bacterium]